MRRKTYYAEWIAAVVGSVLAPMACGGQAAPLRADADGTRSDGGANDGSPADASTLRPSPAPLRPGFIPAACKTGDTLLSAFTTTPAFDYAELRVEDGYRRDRPDEVVDRAGTPCQNATDRTACQSALNAIQHPVDLSCPVPYPCSVKYLITTRGDEVKTFIGGKDDLAKLAVPISTIDEALFVATWMRPIACTSASYRTTADGFDVAYSYETDYCTSGTSTLHDVLIHITRDGVITQLEDKVTPLPQPPNTCAAARRASGVAYALPPSASRDVGAWLASAAYLEAASVGSFARLARELSAHDAPRELVSRVARAAREERRHAQLLRRQARRAGFEVARAPKIPRTVRSIEAVALENAVEGAARETWGAVLVAYQAERASTPELRGIFRAIATDEASHAELAADVAEWLATRLASPARARVEHAYRATLDALQRGSMDPLPETVRSRLGLPSRDVAIRLFDGARRSILVLAREGLVGG